VATVTTATQALSLGQNRPNPFNPQTTIPYVLPGGASTRVRLSIVDIAGRLVRTLVNESQSGGPHEAAWNGKDDRGQSVSSGVYFYVLEAGGERRMKKLVLLK
jgi:flagellar hook assembly protein FlgD